MNTSTTSNETQTPASTGGYTLGQSPTDLVSLYGATPITQPTNAAQAAVTDGSGGTANPATGVGSIGASYSQTAIANAFATIIAQNNALRAALVALGAIKGS